LPLRWAALARDAWFLGLRWAVPAALLTPAALAREPAVVWLAGAAGLLLLLNCCPAVRARSVPPCLDLPVAVFFAAGRGSVVAVPFV